MKKSLLLILIYCCCSYLYAQYPRHLTFHSANQATSIVADGDFIWYGTESCLIKRNVLTNVCGIFNEENSGISFNWISALAINGKTKTLWIVVDSSLVRYDGHNFIRYFPTWPSSFSSYDKRIRDVSADTLGNVWIAMNSYGVAKFDGINFSYFNPQNTLLPSTNFVKIKVTPSGNVWIGTYNKGLANFDGTVWTIYNKTNSVLTNNSITSLALDSLSNLYFSDGGYLFRFDNTLHKLVSFNINSWDYGGISIDQQQNIWVGGVTVRYNSSMDPYWCQEMIKYNPSNNTITTKEVTTNFEKHISYVYPVSSTFDTYGNYWVGQFWGLNKINITNGIGNFYYHGLPPAWTNIHSMVDNGFGKLWFASNLDGDKGSGMGSYDGQNWESFTQYNSNFKCDGIPAMAKDKQGNLWLATHYNNDAFNFSDTNYIYKYDGQNFSIKGFFEGTISLKSLVVDTLNNVWVSDLLQIHRYNGTSWTVYDSLNLPNFDIAYNKYMFKELKIDGNNNLWALLFKNNTPQTTGSKLIKFDGINWTQYIIPDSCLATSIMIDKSNLIWVSSMHGLYTFDGTNWINYTTSNSGIGSNSVVCAVKDNYGLVYIATNLGFVVFDGITWRTLNGIPQSNYGVADGYFHLFCDSNNNIYFCFYGFVYVYNEYEGGVNFNSLNNYKKVVGKVYYDTNQNGGCDSAEVGIANQRLLLTPDSVYYETSSAGEYKTNSDTSAHAIVFTPRNNWNQTSSLASYSIHANSPECCYNFGTIPTTFHDNLSIELTNAAAVRCGFTIPYYLTYRNAGTTICDGSVTLSYSSAFQFVSSNLTPQNLGASQISWSFNNLYPDEERRILVYLLAPLTASNQLCNYAEINRKSGSQFILEDGSNLCSSLSCSADPNEKRVEPEGVTSVHYTLKTDALEYTLTFQNLGNDTAFTIVVKDSLSALLDWKSLSIIGSSAPVLASLDKNGLLCFTFENIKLPYDKVNEPASHGFVKYRIFPKLNCAEGSQVFNSAAIYFDYNYPINTNQVFNTLVSSIPLNSSFESALNSEIRVVPQPMHDKGDLFFTFKEAGIYTLTIYDVIGTKRNFEAKYFTGNSKLGKFEIDLSNCVSGIYFFKIESLKNSFSETGKILKE